MALAPRALNNLDRFGVGVWRHVFAPHVRVSTAEDSRHEEPEQGQDAGRHKAPQLTKAVDRETRHRRPERRSHQLARPHPAIGFRGF